MAELRTECWRRRAWKNKRLNNHGDAKSSLTVLATGNALGTILPPFIIDEGKVWLMKWLEGIDIKCCIGLNQLGVKYVCLHYYRYRRTVLGCGSHQFPKNKSILGCGSHQFPIKSILGCRSHQFPKKRTVLGCGSHQFPIKSVLGCGSHQFPKKRTVLGCGSHQFPKNKSILGVSAVRVTRNVGRSTKVTNTASMGHM